MSDLGDKCHYSLRRNRTQMAAAVTDLQGNILFSNVENEGSNSWILTGVKTYKTRFWAAGSATLVLSVKDHNSIDPLPTFPRELSSERQFCVYLGWITNARPITKKDLEDGLLLRDFIGVVDTVQFSGTGEGGATIKVEARDRMKWLLDSEIYYITSDSIDKREGDPIGRSTILLDIAKRAVGIFDSELAHESSAEEEEREENQDEEEEDEEREENQDEGEEDEEENLNSTQRRIARQNRQQQDTEEREEQRNSCSNAGCGITINRPKNPKYIVDVKVDPELPDSNVWYKNGGPLQAVSRASELEIPQSPEFRIYTTRLVGNGGAQDENFLINQQYPIEMIRFLSFQETYPTEVFQNHRDGHLYYVPRSVDSTALPNPKNKDSGDPFKFYRTYYYKVGKTQESVFNPNQELLNFREEKSTLATKTNFIVENVGASDISATNFFYHLRAVPHELSDSPGFACKFQRIKDPSIENDGEAAMVALAAARRTARETRVGMITTIGDPSFSPGEVIQVFGSPFLNKGGLEQRDLDRAKFFDFLEGKGEGEDGGWNKMIKYYAEISSGEGQQFEDEGEAPERIPLVESDKEIEFIKAVEDDVTSYLCEKISQIKKRGSDEQTTFGEQPPTIFRVEAIVQKYQLGSAGFTTEIALVSPF